MDVNVLIVDSDKTLFNRLKPIFELESINLIYTSDEQDAIGLMSSKIFLVIISCFISGIDNIVVASKADDLFRPVIVLNSNNDCKKELLPMGIHSFFKLPLDIDELATQSINFLTLYQAKRDAKSQNDVFKALSMSLEVRDFYTHGHGERVSLYATTLYDALGFKDYEDRESLRVGCLIHDVGKIGTPDSILKADTRLNDDEFEMIKSHPTDGVKICLKIISDPKVINIIQKHHEKLDGSGYPLGLKGNEISHLVQIATICDIYDALSSDRSYRIRNIQEEALEIMTDEFFNPGKINRDYFNKFKELLESNSFENIMFI